MGEISALTCAMLWALAVVFFRKSGETTPALALNLFRATVSTILFLITMAVTDRPLLGVAGVRDWGVLMVSGVIAIGVADTLFHACLNRVGAGINAIIDTAYSPFMMLFAFTLLGESMGPWEIGGMLLIISGVFTSTRVAPPPGTSRRSLIIGILLGLGAMASLSFGIVIAKPVLERSDVIWATTVRQLGSLVILVPAALLAPERRRYLQVFRPQASWRFSLPGTILGSYLALMFWIAGMKYAEVGTAAVLNQTSTIYILVFASLFLKERFTRRKALAAGLALAGVLLVMRPWT